ncbi:MAG: YfbK domain-containing protein [Kofleriaceae bacterium]
MRHVRSICLVLLAACAGNASKSTPSFYTPAAPAAIASEAASPAGDSHVSAGIHPWIETARDNLSTFAADVDTASYTYARRALQGGALPPPASVRVEEFVNYFKYGFPTPGPGTPFSVIVDAAPSPLAPSHHIVRVGVATRAIARTQRKPASLVFLIDVSGSMSSQDKLPLALQALRNLVRTGLEPTDQIALVTYAGSTRVVLPLTSAEHRGKILEAIDQVSAGGSTAMSAGLDLAYDEAMKGVRPGAISRVIVMSDGDANVGATSHDQMLSLIASRVRAGVTLTTVGFGMGNYRAHLMEQLGDRGNGNNYYVDSLAAANKLFSTDLASMVEVVAKDAKLQIEFDPERVARYRLLGYENRDIPDDAFRNDEVDAGEIGPGHQVTAMYEVQLTEHALAVPGPLAHVRIRHKQPEAQIATEAMFPMMGAPAPTFEAASEDLRFAVAVAAFADVLRGAEDAQAWSLADIAAVARATSQGSPERAELVSLIERARQLRAPRATVAQ